MFAPHWAFSALCWVFRSCVGLLTPALGCSTARRVFSILRWVLYPLLGRSDLRWVSRTPVGLFDSALGGFDLVFGVSTCLGLGTHTLAKWAARVLTYFQC